MMLSVLNFLARGNYETLGMCASEMNFAVLIVVSHRIVNLFPRSMVHLFALVNAS